MEIRSYTVGIVEDNSSDISRITESLDSSRKNAYIPRNFTFKSYNSLNSAVQEERRSEMDILLLDLDLPDSENCEETMNIMFEKYNEIPIIVFTRMDNEVMALKAVQKGAQDYVIKESLTFNRLYISIDHAIERHKKLSNLQKQAFLDSLTGIYNRRGFISLSDRQLQLANRHNNKLSVFFADIDNMKSINDFYGHEEGDKAIQRVSNALCETFRKSDIIGRMGGDEFAVMAIKSSNENISKIRKRLFSAIRHTNKENEKDYSLSVSLGYTVFYPGEDKTMETLVQKADNEMYRHKNAKKKIFIKSSETHGSRLDI
ncbi:MAG: diguanylate cyclase response regulator [bacterium]